MATQVFHIPPKARKSRNDRSYPLVLLFSYIARSYGQVVQRGTGETIEISSAKLRVKLTEPLDPTARHMVMSIAWPAKLQDGTHLKLVIEARPLLSGLHVAEFAILKHEFRTAGKSSLGLVQRRDLGTIPAFGAGPALLAIKQCPSVAAV